MCCRMGYSIQIVLLLFKNHCKSFNKSYLNNECLPETFLFQLNFLAFSIAYVCPICWFLIPSFILCITKQFHKQIIAWVMYGIFMAWVIYTLLLLIQSGNLKQPISRSFVEIYKIQQNLLNLWLIYIPPILQCNCI